MRGVRRVSEQPVIAEVSGTARAVAAGGATYGGLSWLASTSFFQNALLAGSSWVSYVPVLGAIPAAWPIVRRFAARRHEKGVQAAFEQAAQDAHGDPQEFLRALQQHMLREDKELIDTDDELLLIQGLYSSDRVRPSDVPHLHAHERYAKHCFAVLVQLCRDAHAANSATPKGHIPGVKAKEFEMLAKYGAYLEDAAQRAEATNKLLQVSAVYGRLLANHERNGTEGQITGAIVGTAIGASALTGPLVPALVAAGAWGTRKLYRMSAEGGQHLEISSRGELQGKGGTPILSPETYKVKGGTLFRPDLLPHFMEEGQLSDDDKKWLPRIVIPGALLTRRYRSAEDLALAAAPIVQTNLLNQPGIPKKVDEEDRNLRKEEWQRRQQKLEQMETEQKSLEGELQTVDDQITQAEAEIQSFGGANDPKSKHSKRQAEAKLAALTQRKQRLEGKFNAMPGIIQQQRDAVVEAKREYDAARKPQVTPNITMQDITNNESIVRAFCVKVNQTFKTLKEQRKGWAWFRGAGGYVAGAAAEPLKVAAKEVTGGVITTGLYGGGGYAAWTVLASQLPVVGAIISPVTAGVVAGVIGALSYVNSRIKSRLSGGK
ncbi:MAG: hypothetical protein PHX87_01635 [Candidatus Peribacteraceae bacterium]|nr:hypothetical protein [Candidatus Peribacteraceae bacterium]MDD5742109.1 hypothetical protein [Candidatus Peribacteraceae bacterium]